MRILAQILPIFSLFSLILLSCGSEEKLTLSYRLASSTQPDLLFLARLDDEGGGSYSIVPNLSSATFADNYDSLDFGAQLVSCSVEQQDVQDLTTLPTGSFFRSGSCADLGTYIGQVLFSGKAVQASDSTELKSQQGLNSKTAFVFFIAVYNSANLNGSPRCARLFTFEKLNEGVRYAGADGFVTSKSLALELTDPNLGVNCYSLNN